MPNMNVNSKRVTINNSHDISTITIKDNIDGNTWIDNNYPGFRATIIADSMSPAMKRITTYVIRFPRCILSELNTHRALSRNSASSRAIPLKTFIHNLMLDVYYPVYLGKNVAGMSSGEELSDEEKGVARNLWLKACASAIDYAQRLGIEDVWVDENGMYVGTTDIIGEEGKRGILIIYNLNIHKEVVNRLLEPFMWHTALVTGTEWANFFALRTHPKATAAFQVISKLMADAYKENNPMSLEEGDWHLPFIRVTDFMDVNGDVEKLKQISAGRCARVSYLTHEGKKDIEADIAIYKKLVERQTGDLSADPAHSSPLEHQAQALNNAHIASGNFLGWKQHRKTLKSENIEKFFWKDYQIGGEVHCGNKDK